ncbi:MAG: PD40 domain-containing protein [Phycisphaerales bacterium]|nr:PD40 domain-containing protein [Phycisphaerales bacterium]
MRNGIHFRNRLLLLGVTSSIFAIEAAAQTQRPLPLESAQPVEQPRVPALVFVSRQIPDRGTVYWDVPNAMPGVGPYSRVRPAEPGKLLVRESTGRIRTLIDGASPRAESLFLIDVNGPAVSYDGKTIVFAGLPQGDWNDEPGASVGGWRLYAIGADGRNLRQVTFSDRGGMDYSQFGATANILRSYDDFDPCFLPDGRIVFASTRYPVIAQYSGQRGSNLYVVNLDGFRLHRITSERNGADRPLIDPSTGKIVYARWWRNYRFPLDSMQTVEITPPPEAYGYEGRSYTQHQGLTVDAGAAAGVATDRNAWQAARILSDGSELAMWGGIERNQDDNAVYGGGFTFGGVFYANYFPMLNMSEAAGFGGIRFRFHGQHDWLPIAGITYPTLDYVHPSNPTSFGVYNGNYAGEAEPLPDGRVVISWAADVMQDYGLYILDGDGANRVPLYDRLGTSELRARVLAPRQRPPVLPDVYRDDPERPFPSELPPTANGPYDIDGTFVFDCLNVYANAPVDSRITSAPAVGSAATIRFFIDHQRTNPGSFPVNDWPILLGERTISPAGEVTEPAAPANVSLFEQLRGSAPDFRVPHTGGPYADGAGHVTGMNFAPAGVVARCVGCHAGHSAMVDPADRTEARFSNLAPGAHVSASSARDPNYIGGLIDRRVALGEQWRYWNSAPGQQDGEWALLVFDVPVTVRSVVLYNPRFGDEANSTIQVHQATVMLYADAAGTNEVARAFANEIEPFGTAVPFVETQARAVRVRLDDVSGAFYGIQLASLAEIEVIARGEAP